MPDLVVRLIWIALLAGAGIGIGLAASRRRKRSQPPVDVSGLGFQAALIAFTSTECANCKKVMRQLHGFDVPVREVAYELEPGHFETAGVDGVPLVVVVRPDGSRSAQMAGLVSRMRLSRELSRAGW